MKDINKKNILFSDAHGNFSVHTNEEVIASRLNNWKGWKCSAGVNNLHITADGNIYTGTCKVGGLKGNVFDSGVIFPEHWITCTKDWCMCAPEMQLLKSKDHKKVISYDELKNFSDVKVDPAWVGPISVNKIKDYPLTITWDIGRRCNYQCSYCPPSTSNTFEVHKTYGSLKFGVDNIHKNFCRDKKASWIFTGGEPTINPSYLEIVKLLHNDLHHLVHTQSNGSREGNYYSELINYSSIGFSVHLEQFNHKKFLEACQAIAIKKESLEENMRQNFSIRIMVPPNELPKAIELKNDILKLTSAHQINSVNLAPLYQKNNGEELMDYSQEEINSIVNS